MGKKSTRAGGDAPSRYDRAVQWIRSHEKELLIEPEAIWNDVYEDIESDPVAFKVYDLAADPYVGPARAYAMLQAVLRKDFQYIHLDIDGVLGPMTARTTNAMVKMYGEDAVLKKLVERGERFYRGLNEPALLKGRLRRLRDVYEIVPEQKPEEDMTHEGEQAGGSAE